MKLDKMALTELEIKNAIHAGEATVPAKITHLHGDNYNVHWVLVGGRLTSSSAEARAHARKINNLMNGAGNDVIRTRYI